MNGSTLALPDDRSFLAASHAALFLVESLSDATGTEKARKVGILTFFLLELIHEPFPPAG